MVKKLLTYIVIALVLTGQCLAAELVIPSARKITWTGNVGVYHCSDNDYFFKETCEAAGKIWTAGIPTDWANCTTSECNTLCCNNENAGDVCVSCTDQGQTVSHTTIESAFTSAPDGTVVRIPAGTYTLSERLYGVYNSNTILRGMGMLTTVLTINGSGNAVEFSYSSGMGAGVAITDGLASGSGTITVADGSGFSVGNMVAIAQDNDYGTGSTALDTTYMWAGRAGMASPLTYTVHYVVAKSENALTIDPATVLTLDAGKNPKLYKYTYGANWIKNFGIENITIKTVSPYNAVTVINYANMYNSWIKNVKFDSYGQSAVVTDGASRIEIRECYMSDNYSTTDDYAIYAYGSTTGALVENNVISAARGIGYNKANGSVYAYNYLIPSGATQQTQNVWNHGGHGIYNLFEGNVLVGVQGDGYHASQSYHTFFRNHIHGIDGALTSNRKMIDLRRFNQYHNVVGNILGDATWNPTAYEMTGDPAGTSSYIYSLGYPHMGNNTSQVGVIPQGQWQSCGTAGEWDSITTYASGDLVYITAQEKTYKSKQANNVNHDPTTDESAWWVDGQGESSEDWMIYDVCGGIDANVAATLLRHKNYDYENGAQRVCGSESEGCQSATNVAAGDTLPNSLYLAVKPAWFGSLAWPPVDPATPSVATIPAKYFYETGTWPESVTTTTTTISASGTASVGITSSPTATVTITAE